MKRPRTKLAMAAPLVLRPIAPGTPGGSTCGVAAAECNPYPQFWQAMLPSAFAVPHCGQKGIGAAAHLTTQTARLQKKKRDLFGSRFSVIADLSLPGGKGALLAIAAFTSTNLVGVGGIRF